MTATRTAGPALLLALLGCTPIRTPPPPGPLYATFEGVGPREAEASFAAGAGHLAEFQGGSGGTPGPVIGHTIDLELGLAGFASWTTEWDAEWIPTDTGPSLLLAAMRLGPRVRLPLSERVRLLLGGGMSFGDQTVYLPYLATDLDLGFVVNASRALDVGLVGRTSLSISLSTIEPANAGNWLYTRPAVFAVLGDGPVRVVLSCGGWVGGSVHRSDWWAFQGEVHIGLLLRPHEALPWAMPSPR